MSPRFHSEADHDERYNDPQVLKDRYFDITKYPGPKGRINSSWMFVACPERSDLTHNDGIIIATDGACRNNGMTQARAAIGVYLGPNNPWNRGFVINEARRPTSQRTELIAALEALEIALSIRHRRPQASQAPPLPYRELRLVIIKADSEYLVKGMTRWIYNWRVNGYRNANGARISNEDIFRRLDEAVENLNDADVQVQFRSVDRSLNEEADRLANDALDAAPGTNSGLR